MSKVTGEIVIDRPIDIVFDFVADERRETLYNPAIIDSDRVTKGPVGLGPRFHAIHRSALRPVEMNVEIIAFDHPAHGLNTTMSLSEIEGELAFESTGNATGMRWTWDVRPRV